MNPPLIPTIGPHLIPPLASRPNQVMTTQQTEQLSQKIDALSDGIHRFLLSKPEYRARLERGEAAAQTRAQAREVFMGDSTGMARVKRATHFDSRYPNDSAYSEAFRAYLADHGVASAPTAPAPATATMAVPTPSAPAAMAAGNGSNGPYPAFVVRSNLAAVREACTAAGPPIVARLEKMIDPNPRELDQPGEKFDFSWAGRRHRVFVVRVKPDDDADGFPFEPKLRAVIATWTDDPENEKLAHGWLRRIENAVRDRNVIAADQAIRAEGSPDGFDTKLRYINPQARDEFLKRSAAEKAVETAKKSVDAASQAVGRSRFAFTHPEEVSRLNAALSAAEADLATKQIDLLRFKSVH